MFKVKAELSTELSIRSSNSRMDNILTLYMAIGPRLATVSLKIKPVIQSTLATSSKK